MIGKMRETGFILLLVLSLLPLSARALHDHVDIDGAETNISGYRPATETEDGYTGDEVCSVCGAVISRGSVIPALGKQRPKSPANPPDPTRPPAADPTQAPTPVPTVVPTPVPTPVPTAAAGSGGSAGTSGGASDPGSSGASGAGSAAPTSQPEPPAVSGSSGSSASSGSSPAVSGGSRRGSASAAADSSGGRDLSRWPVFSSRFPWRRLRMAPSPDLYAPAAGVLVWPLPAGSSPLMTLLLP